MENIITCKARVVWQKQREGSGYYIGLNFLKVYGGGNKTIKKLEEKGERI